MCAWMPRAISGAAVFAFLSELLSQAALIAELRVMFLTYKNDRRANTQERGHE
jgi:hypothetical protein